MHQLVPRLLMERRTGKSLVFFTPYTAFITWGAVAQKQRENRVSVQPSIQNPMWLSQLRGGGWKRVMFLDGQQTWSRQPWGASSVTGAQEGRAQLDVMAPSFTRQLQCFSFLCCLSADKPASNSAHFIVSKLLV